MALCLSQAQGPEFYPWYPPKKTAEKNTWTYATYQANLVLNFLAAKMKKTGFCFLQ